MRITPNITITTTGANSGKKMKLLLGVPVDVDEEDITHLDENDYTIADGKATAAATADAGTKATGKKK